VYSYILLHFHILIITYW